MVKMSSIIICSCAAALALGCSVSLAEDKPKESIQFNYGKIEQKYNTQRDVSTGQATGKRQHKPITVIKETDTSSPNLMRVRKSGENPKEFLTAPLTSQGPLGGAGGAGSTAGSKVKLPATAK
jgi:type VI protein secretion system component Hcp